MILILWRCIYISYINDYNKDNTNKPISIFNTDNQYGYVLNVNHPKINELYNRYKLWKGFAASFSLSDEQRFEFESYIMKTKTFQTLLNSPPFDKNL